MPHGWSATVNELSELALWTAAGLVGMVTTVLVARAPFFRGLLQKLGRSRPQSKVARKRPSQRRSLPLLAEAIIGSSKATVANVFGPPRSAAVLASAPASSYWQADTWYYPLPAGGPIAMAISFADEFAKSVEFLGK